MKLNSFELKLRNINKLEFLKQIFLEVFFFFFFYVISEHISQTQNLNDPYLLWKKTLCFHCV